MTTNSSGSLSPEAYGVALADYFTTRSEATLYHASLLGQACVEDGLGPEEIVALHTEALEQAIAGLSYRQRAGAAVDALQFLLEVMIAYGVHYQRYLELRLQEQQRAAEAAAEQERQRARALEEADRAKSDVMGAIAHELRTPITAVRGYLDMAARALEREQVDRLPTFIASARGALGRLTRLTTDLTEASRGELPQLELEPIDLAAVVGEACAWAKPVAADKGVDLINACQERHLSMRGDVTALGTIITNLLSNAIRYTPTGGRITVQDRRDGDIATITVTDTGIGIPAEAQAHIFEKFYRASEARAVEVQGLGLGLFLTRQLARGHGGDVTVTSTVGAGSTFAVTLPLSPSSLKEDPHG